MKNRRRLFTKIDKRIVLACFVAKISNRTLSDRLDIPFDIIQEWFDKFEKGDTSWSTVDDRDLFLRQMAFRLFLEGHGYKSVATLLDVPTSRVKFWKLLFSGGNELFFSGNKRTPKQYSPEIRRSILERYRHWEGSKKSFCSQEGISVVTLNRWIQSIN